MTKKQLWIFNQYAITPDMPGGSRHYDLSKELVKKGYDVTIFASGFNYEKHVEMKLSENERWKIENVNGVRFVWIRTPPYKKNDWHRYINMLSYMVNSYHLGRRITQIIPSIPNPETIIGSTVHLLAVLSACYLAKHYRAKFIMEVRDLWPQSLIDMGALSERSPAAKAMYALEKFLYQKADKIITLLPLAGEYITARGVSNDKIVWIPNGVELSRFATVEEIPQSNREFKIMYLGAHGRANILDVLIDAAKIVKDRGYKEIKFILVGDGPEKPRLIARKEKLNLSNVEFRAPIPKSEVPNYLTEADATLLTFVNMEVLYKYGISFNKLFDYMAIGKPIVMAANPVNDIVKESCCGFSVPSCDADSLANAVIRLYETSPEERMDMGKRGRKYVEEHHDIKILAEKLIRCIEDVKG